MKCFSVIAGVVSAAFFFAGIPSVQADDNLVGKWELVGLVNAGESMAGQLMGGQAGLQYTYSEDGIWKSYPDEGNGFDCRCVLSIGEQMNHTIDMYYNLAGITLYGIYKIEGDTLTICYVQPRRAGQEGTGGSVPLSRVAPARFDVSIQNPVERPIDFSSTAENQHVVVTYTRVSE